MYEALPDNDPNPMPMIDLFPEFDFIKDGIRCVHKRVFYFMGYDIVDYSTGGGPMLDRELDQDGRHQ